MSENICRFLSKSDASNDINIIHFVCETGVNYYKGLSGETIYKMHLVTNGTGKLCFLGRCYEIAKGDVFYTFPSVLYRIEEELDLEYMYIGFVGTRANKLADSMGITQKRFLFSGFSDLIPMWKETINDMASIAELRCEGLLLYTFSMLGEQIANKQRRNEDPMLSVKKYIDDNFLDGDISLEMISRRFAYNPKYLSGHFKATFHTGISSYITTLRIQRACTLMEQGFTSVKDIAAQCGFDDKFYFSKVFKKRMGVSPSEHIRSLENER